MNDTDQNANEQRPSRVEKVDFWETLYQSDTTPWDLGICSPPFETLLSANNLPAGKIAVLGSGRGNDCMLFVERGFEVVAFDFAPSAVKACSERFADAGVLGKSAFVYERDIFDLDDWHHKFDYVLEHTCFCAINPARRSSFVKQVAALLKPGGKLLGLFWLLDRKSNGPPFDASREEIMQLFGSEFRTVSAFQPENSVANRANQELLVIFERLNGDLR